MYLLAGGKVLALLIHAPEGVDVGLVLQFMLFLSLFAITPSFRLTQCLDCWGMTRRSARFEWCRVERVYVGIREAGVESDGRQNGLLTVRVSRHAELRRYNARIQSRT